MDEEHEMTLYKVECYQAVHEQKEYRLRRRLEEAPVHDSVFCTWYFISLFIIYFTQCFKSDSKTRDYGIVILPVVLLG